MPTKKKASPESESKAAPPATPVKKKTAAKSTAATHKTTTRTSNSRAAKAASPAPVFDASTHHDEIARVAYFLWLDRGAQHGHEQGDWLRAVEIVKARHAK